jgi:hypothetical protein
VFFITFIVFMCLQFSVHDDGPGRPKLIVHLPLSNCQDRGVIGGSFTVFLIYHVTVRFVDHSLFLPFFLHFVVVLSLS